MKPGIITILCALCIFLETSINSFAQFKVKNEPDDPAMRARSEWLRLHDPATGEIPLHIRSRELEFVSHLPKSGEGSAFTSLHSDQNILGATSWTSRGPSNIGGRTRAIGIDIKDENVILAGGVSGGMWRSPDGGNSWTRRTSITQQPEVSCIAQDSRPGKTDRWYCGTGEILYSSQSSIGSGILKSTDDGFSWNALPSTISKNTVDLVQPFDYVQNIALDPSKSSQDIIYAAVVGGIERSSDGGATWQMVLGDFAIGSYYTDVTATSRGVIYAAMSFNSQNYSMPSDWNGIYRSVDGINWTNISPPNWQDSTGVISLGIAPSNENILYVFSSIPAADYTKTNHSFWKYTYLSGDGADNGGTWEDRSANIPPGGNNNFVSYNGYALYVKVKPDDENVVFLGGMLCYRSDDGLETPDMITDLTQDGYALHPDQHALSFFHSNPSSMIVGNDGGLYLANDNAVASWTPLNNNYLTTQFYTVAIDHATPGDSTIIGGMQDNSTFFTNSTDPNKPWSYLFGGDGMTCAIADSSSSFYVSLQNGYSYRELVDGSGTITDQTRIDPSGGKGYVWTNPFVLDPNNTNKMYFGGGTILWRNNNLPFIPLSSNNPASVGWQKLTATAISTSNNTYAAISAIGVSTTPANRVYYGTTDGQIYRLDNANSGNPAPKSIWKLKGFPPNPNVSCIAVDPSNADNAIVVFSNYDIQSLFYTTNAGNNWKAIGGNLEENPDGSGNGPSCRWVSILPVANGTVYLVGTSAGLFSTSQLNGASTVWSLEGAETIGNSIVDMIDTRISDGLVAIATHGAGIFTAIITSQPNAVAGNETQEFSLAQNYPNPATTNTTFEYHIAEKGFVSLKIYDVLGTEVASLVSADLEPGIYISHFRTDKLSAGIYMYRLICGGQSLTKQMVIEK